MMQSLASTRLCPLCLFSAARRVDRSSIRPWAQRFYAGGRRTTKPSRSPSRSSSRPPSRSAPSRMVLARNVDRPPSARPGRGRDSEKPKGRNPGPFGGMNVTSFEGRAPRATPTRAKGEEGRGERRTKAMNMQGALSRIPYGHRSRIKKTISDINSFEALDLRPSIKVALAEHLFAGLADVRPTPVQRVAIPALLDKRTGRKSKTTGPSARREFLIAAETGSGKTLAYLLPVIEALKEAEAADPVMIRYRENFEKQLAAIKSPDYTGPREFDPSPSMARPRAIILVPTAELVEQVAAVSKKLSHGVKFKTDAFSANMQARVIHRNMYSPAGIDVVVATPHLLSSMADSDPNILSRVTHLVVDEADSLFDRSFSSETTSILDRALPSMRQLILCSATIPKRLDTIVASQFPEMTRITTPNLHAIPRRVQLGVIDVSKDPYRDNKNLACADAIWTIGKEAAAGEAAGDLDVKRIMVFVNEREKTQEVADFLVSKGIDAVALHRDTLKERQSEMLNSFTKPDPIKTSEKPVVAGLGAGGRRVLPNTKVLVATDLASRGIDTLAVKHVILYDVPHTTIDFIHRLGRAGRMGKRGRGVVLVGRRDRRDIVAEVRESMFMGQALI